MLSNLITITHHVQDKENYFLNFFVKEHKEKRYETVGVLDNKEIFDFLGNKDVCVKYIDNKENLLLCIRYGIIDDIVISDECFKDHELMEKIIFLSLAGHNIGIETSRTKDEALTKIRNCFEKSSYSSLLDYHMIVSYISDSEIK